MTLIFILVFFKISFLVPHSCKVHSQSLTGSGFMTGRSFAPPGYLMSEKPRLVKVRPFFTLCFFITMQNLQFFRLMAHTIRLWSNEVLQSGNWHMSDTCIYSDLLLLCWVLLTSRFILSSQVYHIIFYFNCDCKKIRF